MFYHNWIDFYFNSIQFTFWSSSVSHLVNTFIFYVAKNINEKNFHVKIVNGTWYLASNITKINNIASQTFSFLGLTDGWYSKIPTTYFIMHKLRLCELLILNGFAL